MDNAPLLEVSVHKTETLLFPGHHAFGYSLFCGTALAITALLILGRIMLELSLQRTQLGAVAISAAAIDDVIGWLLSPWFRR